MISVLNILRLFLCVCKDFLVEMLNNKIAVQGQGLGGDINLCVQHI